MELDVERAEKTLASLKCDRPDCCKTIFRVIAPKYGLSVVKCQHILHYNECVFQ
jgi:hypothetical protein